MERIYVAGPMRGRPYFNVPAFDSLTSFLRRLYPDAIVASSAEHDRENGFDGMNYPDGSDVELEAGGFRMHDAMRWDLARICHATDIVLLPGWTTSSGVKDEGRTGLACGVKFSYAAQINRFSWNIVSLADHIVEGVVFPHGK
jgi:hypothetical protein